jgi:mannosyl-3-phosphoglycerate phosphatase
LRQTSTVVFVAVDSLLPIRGKAQPGFDEFCLELEHAGIPMVWCTSRSRVQMDEPIRRLGHRHPFIAENGCGAYIPEGYFNLRAEKSVRLGRFTCIPIAELLPAAEEALESASEQTDVEVMPLRSLSPRELAQNLGLPEREAELARQRDFDEPFFFAGASDEDVSRFKADAAHRKLSLHKRGMLWSLSVGGNVAQAARALAKMYQRIWRFRPGTFAIATQEDAEELFPAADRRILLERQEGPAAAERTKTYPLAGADTWERMLGEIVGRL